MEVEAGIFSTSLPDGDVEMWSGPALAKDEARWRLDTLA